MATSPAQVTQDEKSYQDAYNEDMPAAAAQTDDDAFGLNPEAVASVEDDIPNSPEEAMEVATEAKVAGEAAQPLSADELAKERDRLKSWEGRLKARDSQGVSVANEPGEPGETMAEEAAEPASMEAGEQAAEMVAGMSPDEAMKTLSTEFGEDFTAMITSIIDAKVAEATKDTKQSVEEIISDIVDSKARAHFEAISEAHPDFMDIEKSPEFSAFIEAMSDDAKADSVRVITEGTAKEINALLTKFKQSGMQADGTEDNGADAAEGVRSTGMRLPSQPGSSSDYGAAWDEFAD